MGSELVVIFILICVVGLILTKLIIKTKKTITETQKMTRAILSHMESCWEEALLTTTRDVTESHPLDQPRRWGVDLDTDNHFVSVSVIVGIGTTSYLTIYVEIESATFCILYDRKRKVVSMYNSDLKKELANIIGQIATSLPPL